MLFVLSSLKERLLRNNGDIIALAVLLSPIIPLWLIWHSDRINKDGIWHIGIAERILNGDWAGAMDVLAWPLYPIILAGIHLVTGLSLEHSGYLWNVIAYAIVAFAFLSILRELGGDRKVLLFGIAILFLQPALNSTLPGLFRDQGYWAFSLVSILFFIRFWRSPTWLNAMTWWAAMALAALFRVEGIVVLAMLPLALLARPETTWPSRFMLMAKAHALAFVAVAVGAAAIVIAEVNPLDLGRLVELEGHGKRLVSLLTEGISNRADNLADALLNRHSERQAYGAMWAVMLYIAVSSSLHAVNWLYLGLAGSAVVLKRMPRREFTPILIWLAVVNIAIIIAFVVNSMFLSFRYAAGLGFIVMIFSSFGLAALYGRYMEKWGLPLRRNFGFVLAAVLLGIVGGDGLYSTGATKRNELEAGRWVKANISENAEIFFDQGRPRYYSGRHYDRRHYSGWRPTLLSERWRDYEYLVFTISSGERDEFDAAVQVLECDPIAVFEDNRGNRSVIYRTEDCH